MKRFTFGGVISLATLATAGVLAGSALAAPPPVNVCAGEGWQTVVTINPQPFQNRGECTAYTARGGPLLQAIADERCIIDPIDPPNSACFTVTGSGLEPGSEVLVTLVIEGEPIVFVETVDALGEVFFQTAAGCIPGTEEIVLSVSASGVTATGIPLATPTDTFSIFCTRA
jgi:hypothetical protein